jgi:citrate synthase
MIRSEPSDHARRERRYLAEDVMRLVERKAQRSDPSKTAHTAMNWGTPVLDSALTLITENGLYYRGSDVRELARSRTFEEVAAMLWLGNAADQGWTAVAQADWGVAANALRPQRFLLNMQIALAIAAEEDWNIALRETAQTGMRILYTLADALNFPQHHSGRIAEQLARAWDTEPKLLDNALILCADHELNASSFAARVVASTDANLYAVVIGGLAALSGVKHGGITARISAFLRELDQASDGSGLTYLLRERLQRGDDLPGFGHRLYPAGDPRAEILLSRLRENVENATLDRDLATIEHIRGLIAQEPTIDLALCLLERALNLPNGAAFALFALGRTAGWIAHALEQYEADSLIRPRARYVGQPPLGAK